MPFVTFTVRRGISAALFGERLRLAPQDILFVFHEVVPKLPRFPAASLRREATADA